MGSNPIAGTKAFLPKIFFTNCLNCYCLFGRSDYVFIRKMVPVVIDLADTAGTGWSGRGEG